MPQRNDHLTSSCLILEPTYSRRICMASLLTLYSSHLAFRMKYYDLCLLYTVVWLSSINYWRSPIEGFRRKTDMLIVGCSFAYLLMTYLQKMTFCYYLLLLCGGGCYICARVCDLGCHSSLWHCGLHIFANMSNVCLMYSK